MRGAGFKAFGEYQLGLTGIANLISRGLATASKRKHVGSALYSQAGGGIERIVAQCRAIDRFVQCRAGELWFAGGVGRRQVAAGNYLDGNMASTGVSPA